MADGRRDVGNWRIESTMTKGKHGYKFGSQYFGTLKEFVDRYSTGGEILPAENGKCKLSFAADRSMYQVTATSCKATHPIPMPQGPMDAVCIYTILEDRQLTHEIWSK
jgi:hypothetical protein